MPTDLQTPKSNLASAATARQKIDALNRLARELRESDAKRGLELSTTAYELSQTEQYPYGLIDSLANQSHCNNWLSDFVSALSQGLKALTLLERNSEYPYQADVVFALSRTYMNLASFSESVELGQRALNLARESGDMLTQADVLNVLGINYYRSRNYELAFTVYEESLSLNRQLGNKRGECKALINIAQAHSTLGQFDQAIKFGFQGLKIVRETSSRMLEGYILHTLGQIYADRGTFDEALEYLQQSLPIASEIGNQYLYLVSIVAIGQVHARWSHYKQAVSHYQQGLTLADELGSKIYIYRCHEALAGIYENLGDLAKALSHLKQFQAVKEEVYNEQSANRLRSFEIIHQIDIARKEAEIYQLRNIELEQEIAERKLAQKELHRLACTDHLTGLYNRRHFFEIAAQEFAESQRYHRPLSVILFDIDWFKAINDSFGHLVGDQVIVQVGESLSQVVRQADTPARFGGEEFIVLLPETDCAQARIFAERLRKSVEKTRIEHDGGSLSLTISIGIAGTNGSEQLESLDGLVSQADQALYKAKNSGRNRVVSFDDEVKDNGV